jgi:putative lipoic acid-binding regulatory protein
MTVNGCKPKIAYPCRWSYKVVGRDLEALYGAIAEVLEEGGEHTVTLSRSSKGGSYHCLNVILTVESEAVRLVLYERLRRHPAVLIVM